MRYRYYTAILETLSPVHIGCGEKLTKLDYVYSEKSRTVYVLHPMKLFHGLQKFHLLESFEKGLPRNTSMTDFLVQNSVPEQAYASWAMYSFSAPKHVVDRGQCEIQKFVKDVYGMPYIPGSGLKGVLRTAIATDAVLNNTDAFQNTVKKITDQVEQNNRFRKNLLLGEARQIENGVFHTLQRKRDKKEDIVNDNMAGLIIGDSMPIQTDFLSLSPKIDLGIKENGDGHEEPLNLLRETLKMHVKTAFTITIDTVLFPFSIEQLIQAGNRAFDFYDNVFRCKFSNIVDFPPTDIDTDHEMYLYLGGGTGFHHKTFLNALYANSEEGANITAAILDLPFRKAKHKEFARRTGYSPKMIKMTETYQNSPLEEMGLCKLRFEERKI